MKGCSYCFEVNSRWHELEVWLDPVAILL